MILQPLVENSIRHAIAPRRCGGVVLIRAGLDGPQLLLEVEEYGTRLTLSRTYGDKLDVLLNRPRR